MSTSRSVGRSALDGTISVDASYAQELLDFWMQKYEQVKRELEYVKENSLPPSEPSSLESSYIDDTEGGPRFTTENEGESELDLIRACNDDLQNRLAASEKQRSALLEELRVFLAQNATLASEADAQRRQRINSIYPIVAFFPMDPGVSPSTVRVSSLQEISEKLPVGIPAGQRICLVPRPPARLPLRVSICGRHGYWFSPVTTYPEDLEFELIVEGKPFEWTYLGRYMSVRLPGEEMRLCEWLALDDETKDVHCTRAATQSLGQDAANPARVSAATAELKRQYDAGFTMQVYGALRNAATRTRKRKSDGRAGGKRVKREVN